jgi:hypothetical protein
VFDDNVIKDDTRTNSVSEMKYTITLLTPLNVRFELTSEHLSGD